MKISKSLLVLAISGMMFVSCKNDVKTDAREGTSADTTAVDTSNVVAVANLETASFKIDGMTCAMGCAKTIEKKLAKMDGVQKASVDFEKKTANVEYDAAKQTPETIRETVEAVAGGDAYKVSEMRSSAEKAMLFKEKEKNKKKKAADKKSDDKKASCHDGKGTEAKGGCCSGKKACSDDEKKAKSA